MMRRLGGPAAPLPLDDWSSPATAAELELLTTLSGPVLDIGCGPGRLTVALAERGTISLGIDASPFATAQTLARGAPVLCRSVFDTIPGEGRWRTALLFDGNIGIGGDPVRLLTRASRLLHPDGSLLVETGPPGSTTVVTEARLELPDHRGPWFPWAWVASNRLALFASEARLSVIEWFRPAGRWIARLERQRR
jgi:SAM-dependent methyltransferase